MDSDQIIFQAENAAAAGNPAEARRLLRTLLKNEPQNVEAWIAFSEVSQNEEDAAYCLRQALKIEPSNGLAREKLNDLENPLMGTGRTQAKGKLPIKTEYMVMMGIGAVAFLLIGMLVVDLLINKKLADERASWTPTPIIIPTSTITPTTDPCNCQVALDFLQRTDSRLQMIQTDMNAYDANTITKDQLASMMANTRRIYSEQFGDTPPACLQPAHGKVLSLMNTWSQILQELFQGSAQNAIALLDNIKLKQAEFKTEIDKVKVKEGQCVWPTEAPTPMPTEGG